MKKLLRTLPAALLAACTFVLTPETSYAQKGCTSCSNVTGLTMSYTSSTSALISWNSNISCNNYLVTVNDLSAPGGSPVTYPVTGTSFTATPLSAGHSYEVSVAVNAVTTPPVSCAPSNISFTVPGNANCAACINILNVQASATNSTTGSASWTAVPGCNNYKIRVVWNGTCSNGAPLVTNLTSTTNSCTIPNLNPGLSYTVYVSFATTGGPSSCPESSATFSTPTPFSDPAFCSISSSNVNPVSIQYLGFGEVNTSYSTNNSFSAQESAGYVMNFHRTQVLNKLQKYSLIIGLCLKTGSNYTGSLYYGVWIDYNDNHIFEASERVINHQTSSTTWSNSGPCSCIDTAPTGSPLAPNGSWHFTTPNQVSTGLRGRLIYSTSPISDACTTVSNGQVNDFVVNLQ